MGVFFLLLVLVLPALDGAGALAQETGGISGVVRDATGAALPDTRVTLESEIGTPSRRQSAGSAGGYGFFGLPVGRYRLTFERSGFRTAVSEAVRVAAGSRLELDVTLELEGIGGEVEVPATAPIDRKRSAPTAILDDRFLQSVPSGRSLWSVLEQTPALVSDRIDVGGSESGQQSLLSALGASYAQNQYFLNGVNVTDPSALGASATYYALNGLEEVQVSTSGHSAEIQAPGAFINVVVKSGSSELSGGAALFVEHEALQSDNLDDGLRAQGVPQSNQLGSYRDYTLELGGPFVTDRALFYAMFARQRIDPFVIGFFLPTGEPGRDPTTLTTFSLRGNFAPGERDQLSLLWLRNDKLRPSRDAGRFRPTPDTALYQDSTTHLFQAGYTRVFGASLLLDARFSLVKLDFPLGERPGLSADAFSRIELANGIRSGGPGSDELMERDRLQGHASVAWYRDDWLSGSHELRAGWEKSAHPARTRYDLTGAILYRDFFGSPIQVELFTDPLTSENRTDNLSFFAQDSYVRGRLVLNLGVRFDGWSASYPDQSREPGPWEDFFRSQGLSETTAGRSDVVAFSALAPRLGFTFGLTGDARTLLRGSYGRYSHPIGTGLGAFANPNGRASALLPFDDRDGNAVAGPGEIDFDRPLFVSLPATSAIDDAVEQPRSDEVTIGIERELAPGLTVGGTAVYRKDRRLLDDVNVGVPPREFEEGLALDPGRDLAVGTVDDGAVPVFNQSRQSLGRDRFLLTNPAGLESRYRGLVLEARRRSRGKWQLLASLALGEARGFLPGPGFESAEGASFATPLFNNPNTLTNAEGRSFWDRPRILRASGSYEWRWGIRFACAYRYQIGRPLYRSIQVRETLSGALLNQGPVEILAEPQGAVLQPDVHVLDLRAEKSFSFGRGGRVDVTFDVFNAFNANTATDVSSRQSSFGAILEILPPRVARVGLRYRFGEANR